MTVSSSLEERSSERLVGVSQRSHEVDKWLPMVPVRQRLLVVYSLWAAVALVYWPSSKALVEFWSDTANLAGTHGFLLLLIALGLVVRDRARLADVRLQPNRGAFCATLLLSAAWLWFYMAAIQDLHLLLLPLLLFASIVGVLGWGAGRVLIFPVGFLYFAMPAWSVLVTPLQTLSIHVNDALIWLTGLPAYISGDVVQVPAGALEIAGGCAGRHSFVVGLTLAALYGELGRDPLRWRLTWIGLMGLLALVANWARIFVIVVAAVATDMQTFLVTVDHYWFGWGMFLLAFVSFLWIAGRIHKGVNVEAPDQVGVNQGSSVVSWIGYVTMLFCLCVVPVFGYATDSLRGVSDAIRIDWPPAPAGWRGPVPVTISEWQPSFENATLLSHQQYLDTRGQPVEVFVAAYRVQHQGAKLLAYRNTLFEKDGRLRSVQEGIIDSAAGPWREDTVVDASGQRSIIWSRYHVGVHAFVHPELAQLWYGVAAVASPALSSLTALRALCGTDCTAARQQLASAAAQLQPELRFETLPKEQQRPNDGRGKSR